MKKTESTEPSDFVAIIKKDIKPLEKNNKEAFALLEKMADNGFFETHQTAGAFRQAAKDILAALSGKVTDNES